MSNIIIDLEIDIYQAVLETKHETLTKCIVHSGLVVNSGNIAFIGNRQIYRFDYFSGGKFGSLSYRNEIALYFATFSYTNRWQALRKGVNKEQE